MPGAFSRSDRPEAIRAPSEWPARLEQVVSDPDYSRWFARAYVGVDD
jgi:hypothetical protein